MQTNKQVKKINEEAPSSFVRLVVKMKAKHMLKFYPIVAHMK